MENFIKGYIMSENKLIKIFQFGIIISGLLFSFTWADHHLPGEKVYTIDTVPKGGPSGPIEFKRIKITTEKGPESNAFGDYNKDGVMDVMVGNFWYEGPDFTKKHQFRLLSTAQRWTPDDMSVSLDANGDGYWDVVSGGHNIGLFYYENPGAKGGEWIRYTIDAERPDGSVDTSIAVTLPNGKRSNMFGWHAGGLVDVDGDGKKEELLFNNVRNGVEPPGSMSMRWFKYQDTGWVRHDINGACNQWGSGIGDLNGDGQNDIICPDAWFEGEADGSWERHEMNTSFLMYDKALEPEPKFTNPNGAVCWHATQIYVYDVNKDGKNDIMINAAHGFGIYWYEQSETNGKMTFIEHLIDQTWSGGHSLEFEDIDNDGDPDMVTGKRWGVWRPDERGANVLYWYEMRPGETNPWVRHVLSYNDGVGQGTKGTVMDFDGDGDMDVLANSLENGAAYLFVNQLDPVIEGISNRNWRKNKSGALVFSFKKGRLELELETPSGVKRFDLQGVEIRR